MMSAMSTILEYKPFNVTIAGKIRLTVNADLLVGC